MASIHSIAEADRANIIGDVAMIIKTMLLNPGAVFQWGSKQSSTGTSACAATVPSQSLVFPKIQLRCRATGSAVFIEFESLRCHF